MELDLLGLGLPAGHGDSAVQRPDLEKAGSDKPLRLAAATAVRSRMRRRPVDADADDVHAPAPPANRRPKPPSMAPSSPQGDLAAAGQAQVHATATIAPPPLLGVSALAANGFSRPPPFAAWPIFEGSAAAPSSNTDHSTAPLTIIYAGSVRAFDSVPMEQAEKILCMTAKEAQAAETPAFQQPEPAAALPIPSSTAAQMMMLLGLANANDSLLPKRTASLARFLHKRKQRMESAAAMPCPCGEVLPPAQMDPSTASSEHGPKSMKENHAEAEEAVNTDLKI